MKRKEPIMYGEDVWLIIGLFWKKWYFYIRSCQPR